MPFLVTAVALASMQAPPAEVVLVLADPPVAAWQTAAEQRAALVRLDRAQQPTLRALAERKIPVIARFLRLVNGIHVRTGRVNGVHNMRSLPGVVDLLSVTELRPALASTVPWIGAGPGLGPLGYDGTGVRIGIIDGGIDYIHLAFGGVGRADAYAANDPTTLQDDFEGESLFPTSRVVGGTDFAGTGYLGSGGPLPSPDPDPMPDLEPGSDETADHGTHVAAIAAGSAAMDLAPGVAPGADLYALKVSSGGATTLTAAAIEWAADPDGDGDLSDHLDVLNISLGKAFGANGLPHKQAEAVAIEAFVGLGGIVVASAGNNSDKPFAASTPAALPLVIGVANAHGPGEQTTGFELVSPEEPPFAALEAAPELAPPLSETGPVEGPVTFGDKGCAAADWTSPMDGGIAVVERGDCKFVEKIAHASNAGAAAVVVVNTADKKLIQMQGSPLAGIPAIMVPWQAGPVVIGALASGDPVIGRISDTVSLLGLADVIRPGSSRGPGSTWPEGGAPLTFAPSLTAPGTHVVAAAAGTGIGATSKTGTSMAAPHVAGAAAILRQARPEWDPWRIRAVLTNTAMPDVLDKGGQPLPLSRQGAGRVDVAAALEADTAAWAGPGVAIDLGFAAISEPTPFEASITVDSVGAEPRVWKTSVQWRGAQPGAEASVSPAELTVPAAGTGSLSFALLVDPGERPVWGLRNNTPTSISSHSGKALRPGEIDGFVVLESPGQPTLRVPFYLLARPSSNVRANTTCLPPADLELELENASQVTGEAQIFTRLPAPEGHPEILALGARMDGHRLQLAVALREARRSQGLPTIRVRIEQGGALFHLVSRDEPGDTGRAQAVFETLDGTELGALWMVGDVFSTLRILSADLPSDDPIQLVFDVHEWVTPSSTFDPSCGQWRFDVQAPLVEGLRTVTATRTPSCGLDVDGSGAKTPPGLLIFHTNAPGPTEWEEVVQPGGAFECAEGVTLEAGEPLDESALVIPPPCAGELLFESNAPGALPPGEHAIAFAVRDGWDRGTTCTVPVTVRDPPPEPEPEPEPEPSVAEPPDDGPSAPPPPPAQGGCAASRGPSSSKDGTAMALLLLLLAISRRGALAPA